MKRHKKPVFTGSDWTIPEIEKGWSIINKIARDKYSWSGYPVQFEIVSSLQMLDSYTLIGMPVYYSHWSFGKNQIQAQAEYESGHSRGLAYEMIINSNPSICYIMEDNDMMMQLLVSAHAAVGHNHFFKNNYLFKEWTAPESIADYLLYGKHFIQKCEAQYGSNKVSEVLDIAHLLSDFSVFKQKRVYKTHDQRQTKREERTKDLYDSYDPVIDGDFKEYKIRKLASHKTSGDRCENILAYLENTDKYQTILTDWQKEIFKIVRTIQQYFYPQSQTKLMNEGFASFVHYTLMNDLYDQGFIDDGYMLNFIHSHCGVTYQPVSGGKEGWHSINPYALGLAMFQDIQRICQNPTAEDIEFLPQYANTDWVKTINEIVENYRDESFIREFLSPAIIRKFKLFSVETDRDSDKYEVGATQNVSDYKLIRDKLASQYTWERHHPEVYISSELDEVKNLIGDPTDSKEKAYLDGLTVKENSLYVVLADYFGNKFDPEDLETLRAYLTAIWKGSVTVFITDKEGDMVQRSEGQVKWDV